MGKGRKRRTTSVNTSSSAKQDNVAFNRPRFDLHDRQLSRFYEPLVLLYTLGTTRGEHTHTAPSTTSYVPLKDLRRKFLTELAYMCDYDKGGDTVTAIGLESTPQGHVYWVASNTCPKTKIVPFLKSLLVRIQHISATRVISASKEAEDLAAHCVNFAAPRIKKYRSHLKPLLRRCLEHLAKTEREDGKSSNSSYKFTSFQCSQFADNNPNSQYLVLLNG
jgi:hypothetical protein